MLTGQLLALIGAGMSVFLAGMGSAIGVGMVGEAGAGVVSEDSDKFSQVLVLQALPGTQGIYGFLIGFIILLKLNIFGGMIDIPVSTGWLFLVGALPVGIVGFLSAITQAKTAAAGVGLIAKKPEELGKAITFAVMVETYAVLAFLASFLIIWFIPV